MRHDNRIHDPGRRPEPNLFDFVPKSVWREVYCGRWGGLRPVQKAEFVVELVFFALSIGGFVYNSYIRDGHVLALVVSFGVVWLILGAFFYLLTRFIR
jgi:VIT1/CCC1 family predicted Fe2+/Mn2+ transporter